MIWETVLLALRAIRRNVLRSSLTILGVVIGVAAVISMVTAGSGATAKVTGDIAKLGSNMLHVRPGQAMRGPGGARIASARFTTADATAITNGIAGLAAVAPTAQTARQAISGSANWATSVTGTTAFYLIVRDWVLAEGRLFSEGEERAGAGVCLIGQTVKTQLFGNGSPVGSSLRLGTISFKVIGVLEKKGQSSFGQDQDDLVIVPLRTMQRRMAGNNDVEAIYVSVLDGVPTETVQAGIEELLRERRGILAGQEDDFHVRDMKEIIDTLAGTTTVLTALLSAVAGVSLLVGGIGIMNIMMVSVTERTREIGTRLAIGALERDVLLQFLVEAVVLAFFGGLIGIIVGLCSAAVIGRIIGVPFVFKPGVIAAAFLFSGTVGVVFGYFPARKAARLNPIEALRYE
ncbi:ABC transporter permease [Desulfofustis glycolicus]|uniref:Putative ABC transport system permease protein n=1 Tax=Desulfofustis glycolicus DSM 9705 TaxID=1121409 RepID=A0A1M5YCP9_9BACT|nr:ABC transporter permease [Desulfofustis glycolicus]MCB2215533.1 ABC transporter permease [Desulfobulbaceae bacterium]SHI09840.1 putative ABC transport system permease protein [Desulfofustis glycolicus DSM 9705]